MKDKDTIATTDYHEVKYVADKFGIPEWRVMMAMWHLDTNKRSEVYKWLENEKESPLELKSDQKTGIYYSMHNKQNVLDWAAKKNLLKPENRFVQFAKLISEAGELGDALIKKDENGTIDSIGDCVVVLIILANQCGLDIEDCLESAWHEIKDRTGTTNENGTFIKD